MSNNIKYQLTSAIDRCTAYGESKHRAADGRSGADGGYKVFSHAYHDDLCKAAGSLAGYLKTNYPGIRMVRDIRPEMLQGYLQERADVGAANHESLSKIYSHLGKLQKVCAHVYGRIDWRLDVVRVPAVRPELDAGKVRDKVAAEFEYAKLLAEMRSSGSSQAWKALPLSRYAGLRVRECSRVTLAAFRERGGRYGCGQLILRGSEDGCKGGRPRTIDILTPEGRDALRMVLRDVQSGQPIIVNPKTGRSLQPDSINRAISRAVAKALPDRIEEWRGNGCHAFRKAFAQECYDSVRMSGGSRREAEDYANQQLGHGENRSDLSVVYIGNRW